MNVDNDLLRVSVEAVAGASLKCVLCLCPSAERHRRETKGMRCLHWWAFNRVCWSTNCLPPTLNELPDYIMVMLAELD